MPCSCDPANTFTAACEAQKLQARLQMSDFGDQDISLKAVPTGHPFKATGYTEGNERFDQEGRTPLGILREHHRAGQLIAKD